MGLQQRTRSDRHIIRRFRDFGTNQETKNGDPNYLFPSEDVFEIRI